ncbi:beta-ketoacyl synthase N-terminal-like domain-containing protein, partial [Streptomyces sp. b94]
MTAAPHPFAGPDALDERDAPAGQPVLPAPEADTPAGTDPDRDRSLDIAVTGMAGRFPGSADIASWWQSLLRGEILTSRLDRAGLLAAGEAAPVLDDPDYVPVRGLLDDADRFDHELFG